MILYKMCGCNKNRGVNTHSPQTNPVYKPNTWNRPQKSVVPAQKPVQIQANHNQKPSPAQTSVQIQANNKPVNVIPPNVQQTVITPVNVILPNVQQTVNTPVHNQLKSTVRLPSKIPVRAPNAPLRTPYVPIRPPIRPPIKVPIVQSKPANAPIRTPYIPVQNKPVAQPATRLNNPKPVTNTVITRNVKLSVPAQPASIPKPTNIMHPNPQTLLANRINAANRKK